MKKLFNRLKVDGILRYLGKVLIISKLSFVFLLLLISQAFATKSHFQKNLLDLKVENASIKKILRLIEDQSEFYFLYNKDLVDIERAVNIDVRNKDVEEVLKQLFANEQVNYLIKDKQIVLSPVHSTENRFNKQSERDEISGKVTDDVGRPLPGVTVVIKGTTRGTITDANGSYSLSNVTADAILIFSFVGMKSQEIPVAGKISINVTMAEDAIDIEEIVAVGYGTMKKSDVTGAISSVTSSKLMNSEPTNVLRGVSGKIAGVQISQHDNAPGGGFDVIIRGGNSITAGSAPLYIVDGFEFTGDMNEIDPNQIEAIEVLKDASATAVYGARAANGVIIITTKTGKVGDNKLDFQASYGLSVMSNTPEIMTAEELLYYARDYYTGWYHESFESYYHGGTWWERDENTVTHKWIDEITQIAPTTNFSANFIHGSENTKYRIGANYMDQEGILKRTRYNRQGLNSRIDQTINSKLSGGASLNINLTLSEGASTNWSYAGVITKALQTTPYLDSDFQRNVGEELAEDYYWMNENINVLVNDIDQITTTTSVAGSVYLRYELLKDLEFYTSYNRYLYYRNYGKFVPSTVLEGQTYNGYSNYNRSERDNWSYQARLNFKKEVGKHKFDLLGLFEASAWEGTSWSQRIQNYTDESRGLDDWSVATDHMQSSNGIVESTLASFLGRLNYSFSSKYLLTASLRADGASKFGVDKKWGYFPSFALAWRASEESFIKGLSLFDNLKIRGSYGVVGNNQIEAYSSLAMMTTSGYTFGDQSYVKGRTPYSAANENLGWETTKQTNFGLDVSVLNNKVNLVFDMYNKNTSDMLLNVQLPSSSGYSTATMNVGKLRNRGFEFSINTININKEFRWSTDFTLSLNRSKVIDLGETTEMYFRRGNITNGSTNEILVKEGYPIGIIVGYMEDGVYNNEVEFANSPKATTYSTELGTSKFVDVNGDGKVNDYDKVPIAYTAPSFIGGINNLFEYKNLDLSITLRYSYGNDVVNPNTAMLTRALPSTNKLAITNGKYWNPLETDNNLRIEYPAEGFVVSSMVEDGSFLKCDNIVLGYTFNKSILNKINLKKCRVYFNVTNPFIITRYSWYDPEANTSYGTAGKVGFGIDLGAYPRSTSYMLGVNLSF